MANGEHQPPGTRELVEVIAAGIAHEVRNPLNALQLNVEILSQELSALVPDRGAQVYRVLERITRELQSLDGFVAEFLRYARPPVLKLEPLRLPGLLDDLVTFVAPECARKTVSIRRGPGGLTATVLGDRFQLKHALLNLVLNALQVAPPGGQITIDTGGEPGTAWIVVSDDGPGMTPEVLRRAFELFFSTREAGTGLGLPIARRIAEAHGGRLELESEEGRGTVARIELPTAPGA